MAELSKWFGSLIASPYNCIWAGGRRREEREMLADCCILGHIEAYFLGPWVIRPQDGKGYLQERCKACLRPKDSEG